MSESIFPLPMSTGKLDDKVPTIEVIHKESKTRMIVNLEHYERFPEHFTRDLSYAERKEGHGPDQVEIKKSKKE